MPLLVAVGEHGLFSCHQHPRCLLPAYPQHRASIPNRWKTGTRGVTFIFVGTSVGTFFVV